MRKLSVVQKELHEDAELLDKQYRGRTPPLYIRVFVDTHKSSTICKRNEQNTGFVFVIYQR
jgi:hypothetical protein